MDAGDDFVSWVHQRAIAGLVAILDEPARRAYADALIRDLRDTWGGQQPSIARMGRAERTARAEALRTAVFLDRVDIREAATTHGLSLTHARRLCADRCAPSSYGNGATGSAD